MKFLALLFAVLATGSAVEATIVDKLRELGQTTALEFLERAELEEELNGDGPFTVFLPTQEIFEGLPQELLDFLEENPDILKKGLSYHIAIGQYLSTDVQNEMLLPTIEGSELRINHYDIDREPVITVTGVPIDIAEGQYDIDAGNGFIHFLTWIILDVPDYDAIDTLLNFPEGSYTFTALYHAAELTDALQEIQAAADITLLAPIDTDIFTPEAIDEAIASGEVDLETIRRVLGDHVVSGTQYSAGMGSRKQFETSSGNIIFAVKTDDERGYYIEDQDGNYLCDIIAGNIPTIQGVVHVIDRPIFIDLQ